MITFINTDAIYERERLERLLLRRAEAMGSHHWRCPACNDPMVVIIEGQTIRFQKKGKIITKCPCGQKRLNTIYRAERHAA